MTIMFSRIQSGIPYETMLSITCIVEILCNSNLKADLTTLGKECSWFWLATNANYLSILLFLYNMLT